MRKMVLGALKSYPRVSMAELSTIIGIPIDTVRQITLHLVADDSVEGTFDRSMDEFVSAVAVRVGKELRSETPDTHTALACPHCSAPLPWSLGIGETRACPSCGRLLMG
jgi:hypothetical protein